MNNYNYNYNSIVDHQEVEALKEMIFKRARERAAALDEDTKISYTTSVKNDVMDLAHDSFVSNSKNPFSFNKVMEETKKETVNEEIDGTNDKQQKHAEGEIGFKVNKPSPDLAAQIDLRNRILTENIGLNTINNNMKDAREDFADKKGTFVGALNFLNSQASIALVNKSGNSFSAIA